LAHTYNPSYLGGQDQEDAVLASSGKKLARLHFNQYLGAVLCTYHLSDGGLLSKPAWSKSGTQYPRITKGRRAEGVAQVVEHLSNKCKAVSLDLSITKRSWKDGEEEPAQEAEKKLLGNKRESRKHGILEAEGRQPL
jgi:hypothetical protein